MQVTALTAREQIRLLKAAHEHGNPVVVIVTHPFEFLKSEIFGSVVWVAFPENAPAIVHVRNFSDAPMGGYVEQLLKAGPDLQLRYSHLRPNRMVQNRFIRLYKFLSVNTDKFEVVPLIIAANEPDSRGEGSNSRVMHSTRLFAPRQTR